MGPEGAGGPTRFLISAAIVMKAVSTFVAFLADVSKNGMPNVSAYSWNTTKFVKVCLLFRRPNLMISAFYENVFYHSKSSLVWSEILPRGSFVIAFCSYVKFLFVINDIFFLEMKKSESQCFVGFFRISSLFFP